VRLGRREYPRNVELLQITIAASQAPEIDEHAGAIERGDQATNPGRENLSGRQQLPASDSRARRGDARKLDRSDTIPEHGFSEGASKASRSSSTGGVIITLEGVLYIDPPCERGL
jgi:hypothetical protein